MASKEYASLSARPVSPERPSFSGSLSIRAPLTLDDSEFDVSSNGTCMDSGFESEGFVSGEESEMASERPFVLDPETDPTGHACKEEEESVEADGFAPFVDTSLRVMPFAQLSSYDDDAEGEEVVYEVEGDENFGVVRVPSIDDMPENFVALPRIKALDVEEKQLEMSSDYFTEELSIDMPENFVGLPRIKALNTQEEEVETLVLRDYSTVNQSFIANELTFANHTNSDNFVEDDNFIQHLSIDMPKNFVDLPRIKVLDVDEELETVNQSFIANELTVANHMSSDNFTEDENGFVSLRKEKRLVEVEHNHILEERVAQGEYLNATDTYVMSQCSQASLNIEQLSKVRVASNDLVNKEGLQLDDIDRLEGGSINLKENGEVSVHSIMQIQLEVDTEEKTEKVEATSVMIGDSSLLKSDGEAHNNSRVLKSDTTANDLQKQDLETHTDFSQTGELLLDAFAKSIDCTGREPIVCLPTQEAAADGGENFTLDRESEYEKLITINKSIINSKVKLHDASASYESSGDDACETSHFHIVESANFLDRRLQQTVYLENDLDDELFSDCHSHEHREAGLNLGDAVEREAIDDLTAISQESKGTGFSPDGDAESLFSANHEGFMEQISALSALLGSKASSNKNFQQEQEDRNSHEKMNLLRDDAKEHLLYTTNSCELDCSRFTITSADESSVISVKDPASLSSPPDFEGQAGFRHNVSDKEKEEVQKLQAISVKFLRLVQRINLSLEDPFVLKVLCRLVADIGSRSNQEFVIQSAKKLAKKLEEIGNDDLDFSLTILVLGKSGVGKSATINSIFGEVKVMTSAFEPATTSVKEVTGTIQGVKIRVLDTPGLRSSMKEQALNRKILSSIKRYMKKYPVDVILYVDRVDSQTRDLNDLPLLRSISSILTTSIWQRAILTLTHAASTPWDGPSGCLLTSEAFAAQKSHLVHQLISKAIGDLYHENASFMCPVSLVENHPLCGKNRDGECVLPNGLRWRSQLLVLCISVKILCEVSPMAVPQTLFDHWKHFFFQNHSSPLGHPLFSLLQSHAHLKFPANWS